MDNKPQEPVSIDSSNLFFICFGVSNNSMAVDASGGGGNGSGFVDSGYNSNVNKDTAKPEVKRRKSSKELNKSEHAQSQSKYNVLEKTNCSQVYKS